MAVILITPGELAGVPQIIVTVSEDPDTQPSVLHARKVRNLFKRPLPKSLSLECSRRRKIIYIVRAALKCAPGALLNWYQTFWMSE